MGFVGAVMVFIGVFVGSSCVERGEYGGLFAGAVLSAYGLVLCGMSILNDAIKAAVAELKAKGE